MHQSCTNCMCSGYNNCWLPSHTICHSAVFKSHQLRSIIIATRFFTAPSIDGLFSLTANHPLSSSVGVLPSGSAMLCSTYTINAWLLLAVDARFYLLSTFVPCKGHNFSLLIISSMFSFVLRRTSQRTEQQW